jgi:hypothetical protein
MQKIMLAVLTLTLSPLSYEPAQGQNFKDTVSWMHNAAKYNYSIKNDELDSTEVPLENTCNHFIIVQKHTGKRSHVWTLTLDLSNASGRTKMSASALSP